MKIIQYAIPSTSMTPLTALPDHIRPGRAIRILLGRHPVKVWHERHPVTGKLAMIYTTMPDEAPTPNWKDLL